MPCQMRYVCEHTGGLAALFVYNVDQAGLVHASIDTSWQFWNAQRRLLLQLCNHIYLGVKTSLAIPHVVRKGIEWADFRFAPAPAAHPLRPELVLPSEPLARYKLTGVQPEIVWQGVPDVALRRYEDTIVQDFERKTEYLRRKVAANKGGASFVTPTVPGYNTPKTIHLASRAPPAFDPGNNSTLFSPTSTAVVTPVIGRFRR